jgi:parvulin-like peptidyl-prolyl isomerase
MTGRSKIVVLTLVVLLIGAAAAAALTIGMKRGTAVAATVNGEVIYAREVDGEVALVAKQYGIDLAKTEGAQQRQEISRVILDQLIEQRLILQEARARNAMPTEVQVEAQLQEIKKSFPTETDFTNALAQRNLTQSALKDRLRANLAVRNLMAKVAPVTASDVEVEQYFTTHRSEFDRPEQVHVRHILLGTESEARLTLARLKRGTDSFEALAEQYSKDPGSRTKGGDLGFVSSDQVVPEFAKAAFALQPKQISDVVQSQFGYHIIQLLERRPPQPATLDQVRDQVRAMLQGKKQEETFQEWLKALKARAKITRIEKPTN